MQISAGGSSDEDDVPQAAPAAPPVGPPMGGLTLGGIGSDDEDDAAPNAPPFGSGLSLGGGGLSIGSDDEDDVGSSSAMQLGGAPPKPVDANAYDFSRTGAFKLADFELRPEGGLTKIGDSSPTLAHPEDLSAGEAAVPQLNITALKDLETLNELGAGASATVFKARHLSSGTLVAVKCVKILEKGKRDQIVGELRIMMQHTVGGAQWLVQMHNAFYEDAMVYQVLEYMDGGSLEDLVKKHAPAGGLHDESELVRVAKPLLNGLNYLHRQLHQIHRDLKPANVMVNSKGDVKIADFGISKSLESTLAFAETQVGTTCYMSPERLLAEAYSYAADLWAVGLILVELATGKFPYPSDNYFALLGHIQDLPPPRLPDGCGFSSALADPNEGFVALCLDKEPARRPSARDLLKHPWLKQAEAKAQHVRDARDPRLDRSVGGSSAGSRSSRSSNLERSRSNLTNSLMGTTLQEQLDMSSVQLGGMTLADDDD